MAFRNPGRYPLTPKGIRIYAPPQSGVYGIADATGWIYVGEAENVARRLLEHLNSGLPGLAPHAVSFTFELCPGFARAARRDELADELRPAHQVRWSATGPPRPIAASQWRFRLGLPAGEEER
jgi:hypothetical protein